MKKSMIVLYSPIYYNSPGTQFRINLLQKSLRLAGYRTKLIIGRESEFKHIYHLIGSRLLCKEITWKILGKIIAKSLRVQVFDTVILFTDVCASAIPYLCKQYNVILSVENLTPEYENYDPRSSKNFYSIFVKFARGASAVISPSYILSRKIEALGLNTITVPIGSEYYVSLRYALKRACSPPTILHVGPLYHKKQIEILEYLSHNYRLIVHDFGKLSRELKNPEIAKYREPTPEDALYIARQANVGLILEYKRTPTLSKFYYFTSLLQPIIAEGRGEWKREAEVLGIRLYPLDLLDDIAENYCKYIRESEESRKRLRIPQVHKPLIRLLSQLNSQ